MTSIADPKMTRLRRSVLSVPASNERAVAKLKTLSVDAVILDLEDSVADSMKEEGRKNIRAFCKAKPLTDRETVIRVNDAASAHYAADLKLVLECEPDAVLLPKVRTHDDILELAAYLGENEAPESLRIWAMIETPLAILNAGSIAETGRTPGGRLDCLVIGLNDLRKDTGIKTDPGRALVMPWIMQVLLAGRAFGLSVLDSVANDFRNLDPFEAECAQGRAMGFDGKMLIHPAQIGAANRHFRPYPDEVAEAQAIIAAFAKPEAEGLNAIGIDGRMVERLHHEQALALMARVELIKARDKA